MVSKAAPLWFLPVCFLLALLSLSLALFLGVVEIAPSDIIAVLTGHGSSEARAIIQDIRLPRILTGILAGVHFAVAGLLRQTITRNPLADPSIMGVSQGATLSVTGFLVFAIYIDNPRSNTLAAIPVEWLPAKGMLGGLAAGGIIYLLAFRLDLGPLRITLCGIAVGAVGPVVFVGLVAPHLARFIAGRRVAMVLPLTIALGAIVVTLGDLIGRLAGQADEIPTDASEAGVSSCPLTSL